MKKIFFSLLLEYCWFLPESFSQSSIKPDGKVIPYRIGIISGSAGGHLAALLGVAGLMQDDGRLCWNFYKISGRYRYVWYTDLATWNTSAGQRDLSCSLQSCTD
jgi:hypothetical protein